MQLAFYEEDDGSVLCEFTPRQEYQGYPDRLHGGLATTLLDEVIGRAAIARDLWIATAKLEIRYRRPIPLEQPSTVRGWITRVRRRAVEARAEILLADGSTAVEADAVLVPISKEEQSLVEEILDFWEVVPD
jgi:acyl-coenzyme A thioesterase PaaI-like protein